MKIRLFSLAAMSAGVLLLSAGCSENTLADEGRDSSPASKIINSNEDVHDGTLLVKLAEGEQETCIDEIAGQFGGKAVRLFEDAEGSSALFRWVQVSFDPDTDKEAVANAISALPEVTAVQYDRKLRMDLGNDIATLGSEEFNKALRGGNTSAKPMMDVYIPAPGGPDDPMFESQWYLYNTGDEGLFGKGTVVGADVDVLDAWRLSTGDPDIIVAVVDEGVKYIHPDLAANMWVNKAELYGTPGVDDDGNGYVDDIYGYNFCSNGPISWTGNGTAGHGTHVAGLVSAVNNNGIGISSIAGGSGKGDGVRIMSCQVFDGYNDGGSSNYARAIKYAADNGASILQCSFGYDAGAFRSDEMYEKDSRTSIELDALMYFMEPKNKNLCNSGVITDGNLVIFSAGNNGEKYCSYPGAYHSFVCVSSLSQDYKPAWYTNYGKGCNIASLGGDQGVGPTILSTVPSEVTQGLDYGYFQGTSQATPLVSSAAALGLSYAKKLGKKFTLNEFRSILLTSVDDVNEHLTGIKVSSGRNMVLSSYRGQMGTGKINVLKLLTQISGTPCLYVPTGEECMVDLREWFGDGAAKLSYNSVSFTGEDAVALGISDAPVISGGKLSIKCTKHGMGKVTISAIAGGNVLGGDKNMGGMQISRSFYIVSRAVNGNNGGWL